MGAEPRPANSLSRPLAPRPPLSWRLKSMAVMGSVGALCRVFLLGLNRLEVTGLDNLLGVLDRRKIAGPAGRERGLLTICNHVGVLDDPLIWGILPMRYTTDLENLRWGLGAHDICFKNRFLSTFFTLGQVLPTHRLWHSPSGGLYQPTMSQALELLSGPSSRPLTGPLGISVPSGSSSYISLSDSYKTKPPAPTSAIPTYSPNGTDSFPAPAAYQSLRAGWVHVFPEACCHQGPDSSLRYFKWGISRLVLESDPAPDFVPIFVDGTQRVMPEDRGWPRWAPRVGNTVRVVIGAPVSVDDIFGAQRARWRKLVESGTPHELLANGEEARQLRVEVAKLARNEVQKLRVEMGFPEEEDSTAALAETWSKEPNKRRFKSPVDGSLVSNH